MNPLFLLIIGAGIYLAIKSQKSPTLVPSVSTGTAIQPTMQPTVQQIANATTTPAITVTHTPVVPVTIQPTQQQITQATTPSDCNPQANWNAALGLPCPRMSSSGQLKYYTMPSSPEGDTINRSISQYASIINADWQQFQAASKAVVARIQAESNPNQREQLQGMYDSLQQTIASTLMYPAPPPTQTTTADIDGTIPMSAQNAALGQALEQAALDLTKDWGEFSRGEAVANEAAIMIAHGQNTDQIQSDLNSIFPKATGMRGLYS